MIWAQLWTALGILVTTIVGTGWTTMQFFETELQVYKEALFRRGAQLEVLAIWAAEHETVERLMWTYVIDTPHPLPPSRRILTELYEIPPMPTLPEADECR